jgi:hypothetical protein
MFTVVAEVLTKSKLVLDVSIFDVITGLSLRIALPVPDTGAPMWSMLERVFDMINFLFN